MNKDLIILLSLIIIVILVWSCLRYINRIKQKQFNKIGD